MSWSLVSILYKRNYGRKCGNLTQGNAGVHEPHWSMLALTEVLSYKGVGRGDRVPVVFTCRAFWKEDHLSSLYTAEEMEGNMRREILKISEGEFLCVLRNALTRYNNTNSQPDATIIILLIISNSSTCFGRLFRPSSGVLDCVYSLWYNAPTMLPAGYQQAASSVLYTTSCKHSLVFLRMDEIIARNMLSWLKLLIKLLLLHLVGCLYYCISDARSHKHQI